MAEGFIASWTYVAMYSWQRNEPVDDLHCSINYFDFNPDETLLGVADPAERIPG